MGTAQADLQDHPRRCGENSLASTIHSPVPGSPPQVRGKLCALLIHKRNRRITPAGAGKTFKFFAALHWAWDHPRRCGENRRGHPSSPQQCGSPPQVRGKLLFAFCRHGQPRITPAGAGKTYRPKTNTNERRDHPRRCGENRFTRKFKTDFLGSPPQVRGKQRL